MPRRKQIKEEEQEQDENLPFVLYQTDPRPQSISSSTDRDKKAMSAAVTTTAISSSIFNKGLWLIPFLSPALFSNNSENMSGWELSKSRAELKDQIPNPTVRLACGIKTQSSLSQLDHTRERGTLQLALS